MYSNIVLNAFNNPKNTGRISKPDGIASCFNFDNTAHVEFSLRIESGVITKCQFRAQANPYIIAICSTITKMVGGKMVSMVFLDPYSIKKELGDEMDEDITFCIDCVKMAIDDYKENLKASLKVETNEPKKRGRKKKDASSADEILKENLDETSILFDEQPSFEDKLEQDLTKLYEIKTDLVENKEEINQEETKEDDGNSNEEMGGNEGDNDNFNDDFDDDFDFSDFFDDADI